MVARLPLNDRALVIGPVVSNEPRVVAVARNHPLTRRDTVSPEDLADYPQLDLANLVPKEVADAYVPATTPSGRRMRRARDPVADFSELVVLIARGRVVQPTVASAATRFAHPNVICLPIADMPPTPCGHSSRRSKLATAAARTIRNQHATHSRYAQEGAPWAKKGSRWLPCARG
jgi:hypothetical protein